jgi:recombination protein RecA
VEKSKLASPFGVVSFDFYFEEGVDNLGEIVEWGSNFDILKQSGNWYKYQDKNIGNGKDKTSIFLKENPEIAEEIKNQVFEKAGVILA